MREQLMELGIWTGAARASSAAVPKDAPVGVEPVAYGVAQHFAAVELVEAECATASGEPDGARFEQLLQLLNHTKNADLLVLIEIVEIAHGDDALRRNGLIVSFDAWRDARLAELLGCIAADSGERGQAAIRRRLRGGIGVDCALQQIVDLLGERVGELRVRDQIGAEAPRDGFAEGCDSIVEALIFFLRCRLCASYLDNGNGPCGNALSAAGCVTDRS